MDQGVEELVYLIADALQGKATQVFGYFQAGNEGVLAVYKGQQYVINIRPRQEDESFTLYEIGKKDE